MQLGGGSFACVAWGYGTIDKQRRDRCSMLKMQRGPKVGEEEAPLATVVHISSAGCRASHRGQKEVAALAHKNTFREVMLDVARHQRGWMLREEQHRRRRSYDVQREGLGGGGGEGRGERRTGREHVGRGV